MAYTNEIKNEFIARRGLGESYHTISVKLSVSEKTLKRWGWKFAGQIKDAGDRGLEVAIELHNLAKSGRLQKVAAELERIDTELDKKDLSSVPCLKLVMLKLACLELAGKIIGNNDGRKDDNSLSPWEVMMGFLHADRFPDGDDLELKEEIKKVRMVEYGSSRVPDEK